MDKLEQYRNAIKKILTEYYETTNTQVIKDTGVEVSDRLAFDETAELQKAENYLRYTVNTAVWLEVCLLNLMPSLLPVSATKTLTAKPVNDKLLPTVAAQTTNLAQIWLSVMDTAKPSNQKLLAHANLVKLQGDKAILEVTPAYLNKFESSKEAMPTAGYAYAKMLQRATQSQQPITVLIKTANKSSNGRVKA